MGYETSFSGKFKLDKLLSAAHKAYLVKFNDTRRMKRNEQITAARPDPIREAVGLPVGKEGGYFVGAVGHVGQEDEDGQLFSSNERYISLGIIDYNREPEGQHGLWCPWVPTEDGKGIHIPEENKHYSYIEWLGYIIEHFLTPWGYNLSGKVRWKGEDSKDRGFICVSNNKVFVNEEPTALDKIVDAVSGKTKTRVARKSGIQPGRET